MTETFEEKMKFNAEKCIKLLCFTDASKVSPHMLMKDVDMILPTDADESDSDCATFLIHKSQYSFVIKFVDGRKSNK